MPESPASLTPRKTRSAASAILMSGWLWGLLITVGFYAALPWIPWDQKELQRYFTAHWIEYATTGLFFVGMATLIIRAFGLPPQRRALAAGLLDELSVQPDEAPTATVERVLGHLRLVARADRQSILVQRISDLCSYVRGRQSIDGLEGQLTYLADSAAVRMNQSYALIRTITWAVPILGFLGTVIGITMSIANITPDQLESSLGEVTAGLAVAFDTTALSLALSMVLVFTTYVVEKQEQQVLDEVEDLAVRKLLPLFPQSGSNQPTSPLLDAERQAAANLLARTEALVTWQMESWESSLEALRGRWSTTLERQQSALDTALQSGLTQALLSYSQQLEASRSDFVAAFGLAAESIREQLVVTQQVLHEQHVTRLAELSATWQKIQSELTAASREQTGQWSALGDQLSQQLERWQGQLSETQQAVQGQLGEMRDQGQTLLRIVEQEEHLVRLEDQLRQNLDTVRVVDTLDETLLSLNAAVNLLSAKTRSKAA